MSDAAMNFIGLQPLGGSMTTEEEDQLLSKYFKVVVRLGSNRVWTYLGRVLPPFCYAAVASADQPQVADAAVSQMKQDWEDTWNLKHALYPGPEAGPEARGPGPPHGRVHSYRHEALYIVERTNFMQ